MTAEDIEIALNEPHMTISKLSGRTGYTVDELKRIVGGKPTLFETLDELADRWTKLQVRMQGPDLAPEGIDLSVNDNKICYRGKPILECGAHVKVDTAWQAADLVKAVEARNRILLNKAGVAKEILERILQ